MTFSDVSSNSHHERRLKLNNLIVYVTGHYLVARLLYLRIQVLAQNALGPVIHLVFGFLDHEIIVRMRWATVFGSCWRILIFYSEAFVLDESQSVRRVEETVLSEVGVVSRVPPESG